MNRIFIAWVAAAALNLSSCSKADGVVDVSLSQAQGELIVEVDNHSGQAIALAGRGEFGVPPSMNAILLKPMKDGEPLAPCALVDPSPGLLKIPDGGAELKRYKISSLRRIYCYPGGTFEVYASLFLDGKEFRSNALKVDD